MTRKSPTTAKRELLERIRTEGAEAAYQAALEVCRDKKAPAQARATASSTILRAAGLLSTTAEEPEKDLSAMSAAELNAFIAAREARIAELEEEVADQESDGLFG